MNEHISSGAEKGLLVNGLPIGSRTAVRIWHSLALWCYTKAEAIVNGAVTAVQENGSVWT